MQTKGLAEQAVEELQFPYVTVYRPGKNFARTQNKSDIFLPNSLF